MNMPVASVVLIGWIPVCALFFAVFRPVRALTLAYLLGWLVLPVAAISIRGFWDIDKILATNMAVVLGTALFCRRQFRGYRVTVADLAIMVFACGTCVTSVVNGLGIYDGVSASTHQLFYYAVPFLLGRAFMKDRRDLLDASRMVVCGAALYAILAIWEWRMSPQIHRVLYGTFPHTWAQHYRWGHYRPIVCFPHALGLGVFMTWTSLLGVQLYRAGRLRSVMGVPPIAIVGLPLLGLLTSMSIGPWGLFVIGVGVLMYWTGRRRRWVIWVPVLFATLWMAGRYAGVTDGRWMTSAVAKVSEPRAGSLQYRIDAETLLLARAKQRPILGWGGWGRNRARDIEGRDMVATDGLWVIFAGTYGLVGLAAFYVWWCWPLWMTRGSTALLERDAVLPPLLVGIGLQAINLLFNGFLSPVLTLMNGGVVTSMLRLGQEARAVAPRRAARSSGAGQQGYAR